MCYLTHKSGLAYCHSLMLNIDIVGLCFSSIEGCFIDIEVNLGKNLICFIDIEVNLGQEPHLSQNWD